MSRSELDNLALHSFGERIIERILADNGYMILHPERMLVAEQIWRYSHAKTIITTNGTLGHNVLFAKKDIDLVLLDRVQEAFGMNRHQEAISLLYEKTPRIVRCSHRKGDHTVSLMQLTPDMRMMLSEYGIRIRHPALIGIMFGLEKVKFYLTLMVRKFKRIIIGRKM